MKLIWQESKTEGFRKTRYEIANEKAYKKTLIARGHAKPIYVEEWGALFGSVCFITSVLIVLL